MSEITNENVQLYIALFTGLAALYTSSYHAWYTPNCFCSEPGIDGGTTNQYGNDIGTDFGRSKLVIETIRMHAVYYKQYHADTFVHIYIVWHPDVSTENT